jgi:hypothetical protein
MKYPILITLITAFLIGCEQVEKNKAETKAGGKDKTSNQAIKKSPSADSKEEKGFTPSTLDTILTFQNNLQLTLKVTDSVYINEYFIDNKILDSLIKPFNNRHLEALAIEKYLLRNNDRYAKRDSNGLYVNLQNGEWKLLTVDFEKDEADNTFEYFFKDFGYYSVRVQWGEGNGYKLVNYSNGNITHLFGRPYFSDSGEFVIAVNADIEAGYSQNGFQLFRNIDGELQHLGDYEPSAWGPMAAKWIGKDKLILKNQTLQSKNDEWEYIDFYAEVEIRNGD